MDNIPVLTINAGSSSIRFACYEATETTSLLFSGKIDRIGRSETTFTVKDQQGKERKQPVDGKDFRSATEALFLWLDQQPVLQQVKAIGHRLVHGMQRTAPAVITRQLLQELTKISNLDPDHLPAELELIELCRSKYPSLLQVACFDTDFHSSLPPVATRFALPRRYHDAGVRRYGFHGLSYAYLLQTLQEQEGEATANGRIIMAHLGSGASITAIHKGQSIDTSMGFTPTGGLPMSTRTGDLDPGVALYILQEKRMTPDKFNNLINHEAGLLGISETSADMRDLLQVESKDQRAAEAIALFCYSVRKYIGAYTAVLGGLDTLVFSGGMGEQSPAIRTRICEGMSYAGIKLDKEANDQNAFLISAAKSKVKIYAIPTNEELMIANITIKTFRHDH